MHNYVRSTHKSSKNKFFVSKKWCLVIGDLILDQYIFGDVERISPEAPVPVIKKKQTT